MLPRRARAAARHITASGTTTKTEAAKMPCPRLRMPKASAVGTKVPYPMVLTTDAAPARTVDGMAS